MTPRTSLCFTTYCLVNSGHEYLVYAPGGGSFSVNLESGTYSYEWFNPSSGSVSTTGNYSAFCGNNSFSPPFLGDAVLYLKREAQQRFLPPPGAPTFETPPTTTGSVCAHSRSQIDACCLPPVREWTVEEVSAAGAEVQALTALGGGSLDLYCKDSE